jgi:hypothetical protein
MTFDFRKNISYITIDGMGNIIFSKNGKYHRDHLPAIYYEYEMLVWYKNGLRYKFKKT